jgi:hypothetical protein
MGADCMIVVKIVGFFETADHLNHFTDKMRQLILLHTGVVVTGRIHAPIKQRRLREIEYQIHRQGLGIGPPRFAELYLEGAW